jgi:hypothetical protein
MNQNLLQQGDAGSDPVSGPFQDYVTDFPQESKNPPRVGLVSAHHPEDFLLFN